MKKELMLTQGMGANVGLGRIRSGRELGQM